MFNLLGPNQNFPVWSIGYFPRFTYGEIFFVQTKNAVKIDTKKESES